MQTQAVIALVDSGTGPGRELLPLSAAGATANNAAAALEARASTLALSFTADNSGKRMCIYVYIAPVTDAV